MLRFLLKSWRLNLRPKSRKSRPLNLRIQAPRPVSNERGRSDYFFAEALGAGAAEAEAGAEALGAAETEALVEAEAKGSGIGPVLTGFLKSDQTSPATQTTNSTTPKTLMPVPIFLVSMPRGSLSKESR
jgi:hypothetical protein